MFNYLNETQTVYYKFFPCNPTNFDLNQLLYFFVIEDKIILFIFTLRE